MTLFYCYSHCGSLLFFYILLYVTLVHSSIAIILMGKRELVALLSLSSWCLVTVSGSSSRCHGAVCGLGLWYFLIILTYYFCFCKEIYSSEPEPKYHSGANSDILDITQLNSPQRCTSGSAFDLCVLQKRPQVKEMCDYSGYRKCKIKILFKLKYCAMR